MHEDETGAASRRPEGGVALSGPEKRDRNRRRFGTPFGVPRACHPAVTPEGEEPLEWILLTNCPMLTIDDAFERIHWYEQRWIVEEYHKAMKTGCSIESLQFEKIERLEPAIALISAVATTLLRLRDAARAPDAETRPAAEVVDPVYVEVLAAHYAKRLPPRPMVQAFYMHVARLGGHQNRKADGPPGWITLWRGWMKLQAMVDGYTAARLKNTDRCGKS